MLIVLKTFQPQSFASICLIFWQFQSDIASKKIAYKKACNLIFDLY